MSEDTSRICSHHDRILDDIKDLKGEGRERVKDIQDINKELNEGKIKFALLNKSIESLDTTVGNFTAVVSAFTETVKAINEKNRPWIDKKSAAIIATSIAAAATAIISTL